jgi:hypothetical protein
VQKDQSDGAELTGVMWGPAVQRRKDGDDDRRRRGRAPAEEGDAGVAGPSGWWELLREVPAKEMGRSARLGNLWQ